jgi:hypothetical protein
MGCSTRYSIKPAVQQLMLTKLKQRQQLWITGLAGSPGHYISQGTDTLGYKKCPGSISDVQLKVSDGQKLGQWRIHGRGQGDASPQKLVSRGRPCICPRHQISLNDSHGHHFSMI